ncbi:MAG TPA: NUDIX hydrolase [Candidatus Binataceae bacterium]|nr:NUDIX hydrolase [Candidatus Binataceae bacterium]
MARARRSNSKRATASGEIRRRHEVSAGGVIWRRNSAGSYQVALVRPAGRRTWVLPKGHLEPGESPLDAARREVREETGLTVGAVQPLGDISYVFSAHARGEPLTRIFKRVHFFLMECVGGDPSAHDAEIDEVVWLSFDDALRRATHASEQALIAKARQLLGA